MALTVRTTLVSEVKLKPALKIKLLTELKTYARLHAQMKSIEAEMDQRKAAIGRYREEAGVETLDLEGFKVTRVSGGLRKSLDPMKLLEMGCTLEMQEECTTTVPTKPFEKITCPKPERDE